MIGFAGDGHTAAILRSAAHIKGLETSAQNFDKCDLVFIAQDVNSDSDLARLVVLIDKIFSEAPDPIRIVLTSQVPIGFTQNLQQRSRRTSLYYQVDTIIMNQALERATEPEQIIVGTTDQEIDLHPAYVVYLDAFKPAPIVRMSFAAAELTKHAINFYLAAQLSATNILKEVADKVGADWNQIIPALRNDKRIGQYAYLRPGIIGGHLPRDVFRIDKILECDAFVGAIAEHCEGAPK